MADELKPCPFCGAQPIMRRTVQEFPADVDGPAGEYDAWFTQQCDDCAIEQGAEYRSDAVEAWNRRAPLASLQSQETGDSSDA